MAGSRRRCGGRRDPVVTFADRRDAGRALAGALAARDDLDDAVVLGLPRGGVVVAREVADALAAPIDVLAVRKLGAPGHDELAIGAIAEGGERFVDERARAALGVGAESLAAVEARESGELARRAQAYRRGRERIRLEGRTALVVDDGVATGATALVACRSARRAGARRVVLAVPVAPAGWAATIGEAADACVALDEPADFGAVGRFYRDFAATTDDEVVAALG